MRAPILLSALLMAPTCERRGPAPAPDTPPATPAVAFSVDDSLDGLRFTLSDADEADEQARIGASVQGQPLSAQVTAELLSRLPSPTPEPADTQDFAVRTSSLPAPQTGETVAHAFPAPEELALPDRVDEGEFRVLRRSPEGDVPMAPKLSVTFSHPAIALTSHDEAAALVPVTLQPQPPGQWRWVGTRTLLFEPDGRFPMATDFTATVDPALVSANDQALSEPASWSFTTPPVTMLSASPSGGPVDLSPLMVMRFDQAIDPSAIAPFISLNTRKAAAPMRLATASDLEQHPEQAADLKTLEPDRWVALLPTQPLKRDTAYALTLDKGAPSAEGPNTTVAAQSVDFRTFPELKFEEKRCYWGDPCDPQAGWELRFNNPLDAEVFDPGSLVIEPEITNQSLHVSHNRLLINGEKAGRTTYTVTVPAGLTDIFGQTLGEDKTLTFRTGPAQAQLQGPSNTMLVLDPTLPPQLNVYSVNHSQLKVEVFAAGPEQWAPTLDWMQSRRYGRPAGSPPLTRLDTVNVPVAGSQGARVETPIDLSPWLQDGLGQLVVRVRPRGWKQNDPELLYWVQGTRIGLTAFDDGLELTTWASDLRTGAPLGGAKVSLLATSETGSTDPEGLLTLPLPESVFSRPLLVAELGDDRAILPSSNSVWSNNAAWTRDQLVDSGRWLVFDDRGMYKPGETARVKGWVRRYEPRRDGDVQALGQGIKRLSWTLTDSRGNEIDAGDAELDALGGFDLTLSMPDDMNLGMAWLQLQGSGGDLAEGVAHNHGLQVQEFRRPEFEVSSSTSQGPHRLGEHSVLSVDARYYAGGALGGAKVNWTVSASPGSFRPPGHEGFSFGAWSPWWRRWQAPLGGFSNQQHQGRTDASGQHRLRVDFESLNPARPMTVTAQATVMDLSRQAWTTSTELLLHPSALYLGVRAERSFVAKGQPLEVDLIAVGIEGEALETQAAVTLDRVLWKQVKGEWAEVQERVDSCELRASATPVRCTFTPEQGGSYRLLATATDAEGRPTETEQRLWVSGGEPLPDRSVAQQELTLVPSGESFQPGQVAEIFVQAPFAPAEGLLSVRRSGIVHTERFMMEGGSHTLQVPITNAHTPNITVQVDVVGQTPRAGADGEPRDDIAGRPAYAMGQLTLKVPPLERTLTVNVTPQAATLEPGGATTLDVQVLASDGAPVVDAGLAVVVADEAVLALSGYRLPDPLEVFYTARPSGVSDHHLRQAVVLGELPSADSPEDKARGASRREGRARGAPGGGMAPPSPTPDTVTPEEPTEMAFEMDEMESGERNGSGATVKLRSDFSALALFAPDLRTDAQGQVTVPLTLPDSLTRYRVMVVAVAGGQQFGSGESDVTARKPLMLRPSPPRFLNYGDRFELPVLVQNQTDSDMSVQVALRGQNLDIAPDSAGQQITVPANDRVELRFPAAAALPGTARVQAIAVSGASADATDNSLPVWTPATSEAFATYGQIDQGAIVQPLSPPEGVAPQLGGLEVTTSSTALQALTDAVLYLTAYPFECSEQISSRVLAIAALRDVLGAFEVEGMPSPQALEASVDRDLARLATLQNQDGGWGFWRRGDRSWPYLTLHVAHAIVRAEAKGYAAPQGMRQRSLSYLRNIEGRIPRTYSQQSRRALVAYSLRVLELAGEADPNRAGRLLRRAGGPEGMSLEGLGWILPTLHTADSPQVPAILQHLNSRVDETARHAHFTDSYSDGAQVLLHSDRRTDGVLLDALIDVQPDSDLIPKVVSGLLANRTRGRWGNTQENAFILLALDHYFSTFEATTPDFVAQLWLGPTYAGEHSFKGRSTERALMTVPMAALLEQGEQPIVLNKQGAGRMYYRLGLRYAPGDLDLEPADRGFAVERRYEAVDDPGDVRQDDSGVWRIKAGARVRVRLTMVAPSRRYHVALVDPLPAGLEALNSELAVTGAVPEDPEESLGPFWWWQRSWYEHQNMRDERAEAFTSLLWEGVHNYSYVARATTPGEFVVPPAKAEEMYSPETFGRSGTDRVVVE